MCHDRRGILTPRRAYARQDENGIDVTQIDCLLSLTPTQRLVELEQFLDEVDALMKGREATTGGV
jgi:hypothetical protein